MSWQSPGATKHVLNGTPAAALPLYGSHLTLKTTTALSKEPRPTLLIDEADVIFKTKRRGDADTDGITSKEARLEGDKHRY
jgi:hypothetical protein